jgi:hypothetical protein
MLFIASYGHSIVIETSYLTLDHRRINKPGRLLKNHSSMQVVERVTESRDPNLLRMQHSGVTCHPWPSPVLNSGRSTGVTLRVAYRAPVGGKEGKES